ncbi:MAG TPA: hypothetical protein VK753_06185 [Xanthomonadaceae bacterium]|jgi:hypothetical protein|nr:hypothetical protein [Xanthomonadaceae bacterium]
MINGAHVILYSTDAEADRNFLRDNLKFPHVDAGHGWLIFALPPSEVAIHPASAASHELFLICDDIHALVARMMATDIACSPIEEARWGSIVRVTLPGGGSLGIYQPKHARPGKGRE